MLTSRKAQPGPRDLIVQHFVPVNAGAMQRVSKVKRKAKPSTKGANMAAIAGAK